MAAVYAIIPVFIIIFCGYLCRRYRFPGDDFWSGAEKITYFLLFPALLVSKMATANLSGIAFFWPLIVAVLLYLSITLIFVLLKPVLSIGNAQFTSVYQGGMRFNTYIGLAVANSLYGPEGLIVAVIVASIMIPMINVSCVLLLEYYSDKAEGNTQKRIVKSLITNPLILACLIGMGINLSGISMPAVIEEALNIFSRAALPLGLLTVGAALVLNSIKASIKPIIISSIAKFIVLPSIAMGLCYLFPIEPMIRNAILVFTVLPTATASYVLAKQLGGDHELMATIITVQTLLAGVLMPFMFIVFA
ncbi:MAG: AEC family transporter [Cellvibrionaceae bacterium]